MKNKFISDAGQELKKVTWPTQDTVVKATILVLGIVVMTTVFVGGLDAIFSKVFFIVKGIN